VAAVAGIAIAYAMLSSQVISTLWILLPSVVILSIIQSLTKNASALAGCARLSPGDGQFHGQARALARRAFGGDRSAVSFDQGLNDGQA